MITLGSPETTARRCVEPRLFPTGRVFRPDPSPLLIPQRRRVHRQIEQRDVVRQCVVQDGRHDVGRQRRQATLSWPFLAPTSLPETGPKSAETPTRPPNRSKSYARTNQAIGLLTPSMGFAPAGPTSSSKFAPGEFVQHRVAKETLRLRFVGSYRGLPTYGNAEVRAWMVAKTRNSLSGQCPDAYNKGIQDQSGGAP